MHNHLLVGYADKTERLLQLTSHGFLLIDDGPIADAFLAQFPRAKLFDPTQHSFNPLRGIDYKRSCDFIEMLHTAMPAGLTTLTKEDADFVILKALLDNPKRLDTLVPDSTNPAEHKAHQLIERLKLSPVLNDVLCRPPNFSFKGSVVARLDRAELSEFDAFVLALLLIGQTKGQVIVPDFGFYGRPLHSNIIRQNRLTAGLNFLAELEPTLRQAVLSMEHKTVYRTTTSDVDALLPSLHTAYSPEGEPRTTTQPAQLTEMVDGDYRTTLPPAPR